MLVLPKAPQTSKNLTGTLAREIAEPALRDLVPPHCLYVELGAGSDPEAARQFHGSLGIRTMSFLHQLAPQLPHLLSEEGLSWRGYKLVSNTQQSSVLFSKLGDYILMLQKISKEECRVPHVHKHPWYSGNLVLGDAAFYMGVGSHPKNIQQIWRLRGGSSYFMPQDEYHFVYPSGPPVYVFIIRPRIPNKIAEEDAGGLDSISPLKLQTLKSEFVAAVTKNGANAALAFGYLPDKE